MPPTEEGDLLVIENAGAYGYAMSSTYNMRSRPSEIVVSIAQHDSVRNAVVGAITAAGGSVSDDHELGFDAGDGAFAWLTRVRLTDRGNWLAALRFFLSCCCLMLSHCLFLRSFVLFVRSFFFFLFLLEMVQHALREACAAAARDT